MNEEIKYIELRKKQVPPNDRIVILEGDIGDNDLRRCVFKLTTQEAEKFKEFIEIIKILQRSHSKYYKTSQTVFEDVAECLADPENIWRNTAMSAASLELCLEVLGWDVIPLEIHTILGVEIYGIENNGKPLYATPVLDSTFKEEEKI